MMTINLTDFVRRQFKDDFKATKITDMTPEQFMLSVNEQAEKLIFNHPDLLKGEIAKSSCDRVKLIEGYAPFCRLLFIDNFTNAKTGTVPITMDNFQYLQSDYKKRTPNEKAVLTRFFNIPSALKYTIPVAKKLMVILYSKEQIDAEALEDWKKNGGDKPQPFYEDFGIISINGQMVDIEEPMNPTTMIRNALGKEEGGSGVPLDKEAYEKSVEFWKNNAIVV